MSTCLQCENILFHSPQCNIGVYAGSTPQHLLSEFGARHIPGLARDMRDLVEPMRSLLCEHHHPDFVTVVGALEEAAKIVKQSGEQHVQEAVHLHIRDGRFPSLATTQDTLRGWKYFYDDTVVEAQLHILSQDIESIAKTQLMYPVPIHNEYHP